jgi:hypothetical protein
MAKTVKEMPAIKRGRPELYPYKQWFNGKKWELKPGTDFTVDAASMKAALYAAQTRMGYLVTIRTVRDEKTGEISALYVQRLTGAVAKNHKRKGRPKKVA